MTVGEMAQTLSLRIFTGETALTSGIATGYAGDLLSDVMSHCKEGSAWMTIQTHQNIIAVAVLTGVSAVIVCGGRAPEEDTLARAQKENIAVLGSNKSLYETVGKVYNLLV
ncbi:MAG: DRTGG domain-containing protein [Bacillota bacterium]|jgi:hypothetical protein|nr:DRTGG domain-containing protein [Bacillota bacterium]